MRKRRILGSITILSSFPSLVFLVSYIFLYSPEITDWIIWEKIGVIISCFAGGILLWKGNMWGYILSTIGWAILLFINTTILVISYVDWGINVLYSLNAWLNIAVILCGSFVIYILSKNLLRRDEKSPASNSP